MFLLKKVSKTSILADCHGVVSLTHLEVSVDDEAVVHVLET